MEITKEITDVSAQRQTILDAIAELEGSTDPEKKLSIIANSTQGNLADALEGLSRIHKSSSEIVLETQAIGNINPAGLLLVAAGKPGLRRAHYTTIFALSTVPDDGKKKTKDPYASTIIETLVSLGAKRKPLEEMMKTQKFITSTDAKRLKILDDSGIIQSRYKEEKDKEKTSVEATANK